MQAASEHHATAWTRRCSSHAAWVDFATLLQGVQSCIPTATKRLLTTGHTTQLWPYNPIPGCMSRCLTNCPLAAQRRHLPADMNSICLVSLMNISAWSTAMTQGNPTLCAQTLPSEATAQNRSAAAESSVVTILWAKFWDCAIFASAEVWGVSQMLSCAKWPSSLRSYLRVLLLGVIRHHRARLCFCCWEQYQLPGDFPRQAEVLTYLKATPGRV